MSNSNSKKASPYGNKKYTSIDAYHADFSEEIQTVLNQLREIIKSVVPNATEIISYNIPTFKQNKNLVHYAAYKNHIGFYPTAMPMVVFKEELAKYKTSKGAIQIPLDKPLPKTLIKKIVKYRVQQDSL